ncbi:TetR/AcrR family transcriptional regulator [Taibaiella koreensis]|uniref:TetR/AcrR family transcriptional regulator n=1 Tax=Taibaiella koreensis TaxID=1268548 RepID=UPI000E59F4D1|nr:TetR/AcrR family transcriptional regulator [Taibaiella koreensis]
MRAKDYNKETAIREQAIAMIVAEGFHGLSMQKLAKAAEISPSTIYIYFDSREDLLNKLFYYVEDIFNRETLKGFDPGMGFEEGLWLQWKNRYRYAREYPLHFFFSEQFRNSPLIRHKDIRENQFRSAMQEFVQRSEQRGEIAELPPEVFWSLAYGPFYTLLKFHMGQSNMAGKSFALTDHKLKHAFRLVLKALMR